MPSVSEEWRNTCYYFILACDPPVPLEKPAWRPHVVTLLLLANSLWPLVDRVEVFVCFLVFLLGE